MGAVHASLQVVNKTNTDITKISVSDVDEFDWEGGCGPDISFNGVAIGAKQSEERQLAMKRIANHCPFNMTLRFQNGKTDTFRIHQKYAVRRCSSGFKHLEGSHNITYEKGDRKIIINIENTEQQLQNEQAKQQNKEEQVAMREKQYETEKFDKAYSYNKAQELEKAATEALEAGKNSNKIDHYKTAKKKCEEALNMYKAAKENAGDKIHSEKFVDFSQHIDNSIERVNKIKKCIVKEELRLNMSKAHSEENEMEEKGNQVGINIKFHKLVETPTTDAE